MGDSNGNGKAISAAAGAGIVGIFAGFSLSPEQGAALVGWLEEFIGAIGFVAIICLGAGLAVSVTANWLMWGRLREKDGECRNEMNLAEARWERRFQELRSDTKEAFGIGAALTKQVTLLVDRTGTNTRSQNGPPAPPKQRSTDFAGG